MKASENTLTLADAVKITGPVAFNIMFKPAGSLCNLDCHYCYYLDKADLYGGWEPRMTEAMLERCIQAYIEANDVPEVFFHWHGGEPLVLGLDFYRKAVEFEKKYAGDKVVHNTLQTNATLMTREAARFFRDNGFLVGVSIDGPRDLHDRFRKDRGGGPTFDKVMRGIALLQEAGTEFNTLSTVNSKSEGRGLDVYRFLQSIGSRYMQFLPVVEHVVYPAGTTGRAAWKVRPHIVDPGTDGAVQAPWSVGALAFGHFLCDIFDEWVRRDVGRYFVNIFDAALASWCGVQPGTCTFAETCGGNAVIEHNGDLYSCDHFVYPAYRLGNVLETPIRDLMQQEAQVRFGLDKRNTLPGKCLRCEYGFACHGECPKHRFNRTEAGQTGLNALCDGYRMFFAHAAPYMERMRDLLLQQQAPALVMPWARMRPLSRR